MFLWELEAEGGQLQLVQRQRQVLRLAGVEDSLFLEITKEKSMPLGVLTTVFVPKDSLRLLLTCYDTASSTGTHQLRFCRHSLLMHRT